MVILTLFGQLFPASNNTIREEMRSFRTYDYGDPNPVAEINKIYPYYRFDGYTRHSSQRKWKVVILENDFIKVLIAPEIGGKILGAIDKSTGKEFIYFNKLVKFRDIAMRGPWTSGGIEFNFGTIGHAPTTSSPVDYKLENNSDGSVSCTLGATDLPSKTKWRVVVKLEKDKSYFETKVLWYNPTNQNTSLYHWMNAAAKAAHDLKFYYPGQTHIDHSGNAFDWPVSSEGIELSYYRNNDFGGSKSYHVLGSYTDYWGGYYQDEDRGFGHFSNYTDKPGKKVWIWALSRSGAIWEDLLTDSDLGNTQYVEIQSGLLFNQAGGHSTKSPFKHQFLYPGQVEQVSEYWFPVNGIGGITYANRFVSLNVARSDENLVVKFCANQFINDSLKISSNNKIVHSQALKMAPTQSKVVIVEDFARQHYEIKIGQDLLNYSSNYTEERKLSRPVEKNKDFDWNSQYGLLIKAREYARQRNYQQALITVEKCLELDSNYNPALNLAGALYYRKMQYQEALHKLRKSLENNTYDPEANFYYGNIHKKLGNYYDALDGYGIAARSLKYRSQSYYNIASLYFILDELQRAEEFAKKALKFNAYNLNAHKLLTMIYRKNGQLEKAQNTIQKLLEIDPLNHFANFEEYLITGEANHKNRFLKAIKNESPRETFLTIAAFYQKHELYPEMIELLSSENFNDALQYLWLARAENKLGNQKKSQDNLKNAALTSPYLIFPHRKETGEILKWAVERNNSWKFKYYLGMIYWSKNRIEQAQKYFTECGNPDFAPFYLSKAKLFKNAQDYSPVEDFRTAMKLDEEQWRAYHQFCEYYNQNNQYQKALKIITKAAERFSHNYIINYDLAQTLLYNDQYEKCIAVLDTIQILPNEGARYGHDTYRQAYLMWTLQEYQQGDFKTAIGLTKKAKLWPENLGVGKPYNPDERIENLLLSTCYAKIGKDDTSQKLQDEILAYNQEKPDYNSSTLISIYTLILQNEKSKADQLYQRWKSNTSDSNIVNWSADILFGEKNKAYQVPFAKNSNQGTPWNPANSDRDFKLVHQLLTILKEKG